MRRLIVDGMNVIGVRPDGWWRDREGAARRLLQRLESYSASGGVQVTLVLDGWSRPGLPEGDHGGVLVIYARDAGFETADDRIIELLAADSEPSTIEVVTSDRALRERVHALGATTGRPRSLLERLDEPGS